MLSIFLHLRCCLKTRLLLIPSQAIDYPGRFYQRFKPFQVALLSHDVTYLILLIHIPFCMLYRVCKKSCGTWSTKSSSLSACLIEFAKNPAELRREEASLVSNS